MILDRVQFIVQPSLPRPVRTASHGEAKMPVCGAAPCSSSSGTALNWPYSTLSTSRHLSNESLAFTFPIRDEASQVHEGELASNAVSAGLPGAGRCGSGSKRCCGSREMNSCACVSEAACETVLHVIRLCLCLQENRGRAVQLHRLQPAACFASVGSRAGSRCRCSGWC